MPTTVAVTGAGGFCGSYVAAAAAARGARVLSVGRRPGPVGRHVPWDPASGSAPDLAGADVVIHCAGAVGDPPPGSPAAALLRTVNVTGTARMLEAAAGRPVVWLSSAVLYAPAPGRDRVREEHPLDDRLGVYGLTKAAGEALALAAGAVVLRPRAVYGVGDGHLAPRLLARARRGLLLLPGRDTELSLTAVENLADACLSAVDDAAPWPPGAYNIADESPYRRDEAVRTLLAAHGVHARVGHLPLLPARTVAAAVGKLSLLRRRAEPFPARHAVDALARGVVLDVTKARRQGWTASRTLAGYAEAVAAGSARSR